MKNASEIYSKKIASIENIMLFDKKIIPQKSLKFS
jgi:hypothetical protein